MNNRQISHPLHGLFRNILLLVIVVYIASIFYIWQETLKRTESSLHNINAMLIQGVRTTLKGHELILRGLGEELIEKGALEQPENGRELIERMKNIDPGMVGFGLARPDGQLILVSGFKAEEKLPNLAKRTESKTSFNEVLKSKHLQTGRPYFFKALGKWVIPIRTPIFNKQGEVLAIMTAGYSIENATVAWLSSDFIENTQTALMRNDGYLIFIQKLPSGPREQILKKMYGQAVSVKTQKQLISFDRKKTFTKIYTPRTDNNYQYIYYNYIAEYDLHAGALIGVGTVINNWLGRMLVPTLLFIIFLLGGGWAFRRAHHEQICADIKIGQLSAWQEAILDGADYSIISTDLEGTIVNFNRAAQRMLGYTADEIVGKATPELIHDKNEIQQRAIELSYELGRKVEPGFEVFVAMSCHGEADEGEWSYIHKNGSVIPVYLSVTALFGNDGEIIGFLGVAADLSEKKAIQAKLHESESRYRTLFENAEDAIFLMKDDYFIDCNPATLTMFGCERDDIIGGTPQRYSPEFQADGKLSSKKALEKVKATFNGERQFFEWQHLKLDGTPFEVEVSLSTVELYNQSHILATVRDITERKRFSDELIFQARHDSLTGLLNRTSLHEIFNDYINIEYDEGKYLSLLLLDLDRFKEINDTLGHHVGDEVLKQIGPRLEENCTNNCITVARLGGDEFAILINTSKSVGEGATIANKALEVLREPFVVEGIKLTISASIGIACYPDDGDDSHELLRAADVAMYQAKKLSLGVMHYDDKYDNYNPQRLAFANELKQAVQEKQLVLHYQPKIDLASGEVASFEALVRWQHPSQGLLFPDAFIDLVEMSEVIHDFTQAVIETAITEKVRLHALGYAQPVAINLSARNLWDDSCFNTLDAALENNKLSAKEVELELTESAVMHDPENAITLLNQFKDRGINIAIDDFGTGYSSLAYLRQLPVAALKIDRTFVIDMANNIQDRAIVQSTIVLAHSLDLKVIAEGVENDETLALLKQMNCNFAQGYGICRPKPLAELIDWLSENSSTT